MRFHCSLSTHKLLPLQFNSFSWYPVSQLQMKLSMVLVQLCSQPPFPVLHSLLVLRNNKALILCLCRVQLHRHQNQYKWSTCGFDLLAQIDTIHIHLVHVLSFLNCNSISHFLDWFWSCKSPKRNFQAGSISHCSCLFEAKF